MNATDNEQSQSNLQNEGKEQQNNTNFECWADLPSTSSFDHTSGNQTVQKYPQSKRGSPQNITSISFDDKENMPNSTAAKNIRNNPPVTKTINQSQSFCNRGGSTQVRQRNKPSFTMRNNQCQASRSRECQLSESISSFSENMEHSTFTENEPRIHYETNLSLVFRNVLFVIIVLLLITFFVFVCNQVLKKFL